MVKPADISFANRQLDDAGFKVLFRENFVPFCAYYQYKFGFSLDLAKEVVHIGFVKLWENRASVPAEIPVKAWLRKTITNTCLDMLKHDKITAKHAEKILQDNASEPAVTSLNEFDYKKLASDINEAVAALPGQMRTIFELSRNEGLKYIEISHRLNISVKTVETQMSRALARLRTKLSRYLVFLLMAIFLKA